MKLRDLQEQIEVLYGLRGHSPKDAELARLLGLTVSVGEFNKAIYQQVTRDMPVAEMRNLMESEMINLLSFIFAVGSYYDIDIGESLAILQARVLDLIEDLGVKDAE